MGKELCLLAVDLGASNGRLIMGKYDGQRIDLNIIHKFPNRGYRLNTGLYWDILYLFSEIKKGLVKAVNEFGQDIKCLGIDTWGVDYGLLDKAGNLLSFPYHYRDERTRGIMEEVLAILPKEEIYQETGIQFLPFNTVFQLYADRKYRPWILDNADSLLFIPDLLNYFLTGMKFNEYTVASTSQLFNPVKGSWSGKIFAKLGLSPAVMKEIIKPGEVIGRINSQIKEECNLKGNVSVMAVGSHDTASAVAATPLADREHSVYISCGTWSLLGMELDEPLINQESLEANFTNELGVGNKVRFLKNITGLWVIQECRRIWTREGKDLTYQEISRAAEEAEPLPYKIDPNDPVFLNPDNMIEAIKEYCRRTEQPVPETYGQIARGIYESLAFSHKRVINSLEKLVNKEISSIYIVGGGSQAGILCRYTADLTEKEVIAGPVEATAMGNILAQLIGLGELKNLEEGREVVRKSVQLKKYLPR